MGKAGTGEKESRLKKKARTHLILLVALSFAAAGLFLLTDNRNFEVTSYRLGSDKVKQGFRVALLSDLHEHEYGEGNSELIQAITDGRPDLIIMAGDMINDDDADVGVLLHLCDALSPAAPICFVPGNHEWTLMFGSGDGNVPLGDYLFERGIDILYNGSRRIDLNGESITLGAFSYSEENMEEMDEAWFLDVDGKRKEFEESEGFKIAISHFPSTFYEYLYGTNADLAVAGHYHGGLARLPYVGGLYHMDDGFFPRYSGGKYCLDRAILIVSRGLGGHEIIPRFDNKPELVMIDILPSHPEGDGE